MKTNRPKEAIERDLELYGIDGKFFLLTRDHTVEITKVGGGHDGFSENRLFHYGSQGLTCRPVEEIDDYGRNYLDQVFIALCRCVEAFVAFFEPCKDFKLLTTRKEGDKYMVRVQYDDVDLEMEVGEMYNYFVEKVNALR